MTLASIAQHCCVAAIRAAAVTARGSSRPPAWSLNGQGCPPNRMSRKSLRISTKAAVTGPEVLGMSQVLFVEVGMGADQHGQDATKAAVRACRNAIEFNSIPSIRAIVPGGYDRMKLHIQIGAPEGADIDLDKYGNIVEPIDVCVGGLLAKSGIAIPEMGDKNDDFYICVASITVGY